MAFLRRFLRVLSLAAGIYVFALFGTQLLMELRFPMAVKLGPVTAVLFWDTGWLAPQASGD